jgi:hypothetical protein
MFDWIASDLYFDIIDMRKFWDSQLPIKSHAFYGTKFRSGFS